MRFGGLIAAVVFAAIAAIVVMRMSGGSEPAPAAGAPAQQTATVNIYVAAKAVPIGSTLTEDMVATQPWPEHLALDGFIQADGKTNVNGMVARSPFQLNEPLMMAKLANPNDPNFLAGDLPKGMRVITVPINEIDGVAGFIFPGDRVDVVYTHEVDKWEYPPNTSANPADTSGAGPVAQKAKTTVTETVLTNVTVLAIDQRASSAGAVDNNGNLIIPRSASLMVSQADAQRVKLAQKTGTISLILRSLADRESADPLVLTTSGDVTQNADVTASPAAGQADKGIKILRGAPATDKEIQSNGTVARPTTVTRGVTSGTAVAPSAAAPAPATAPAPAAAAPTTTKVNPGLAAAP